MQSGNFRFKPKQVNDLAAACCTNGLVLAWEPGLGKTLATIVYATVRVGVDWATSKHKRGLYPKKAVLIVAPENLHDQMCDEWCLRFGIREVTRLDSQDTYLKLSQNGLSRLRAGYYLSSYTQMGMNKVRAIPDPDACPLEFNEVAKIMFFYGVELADAKAYLADGEDPEPPPNTNQLLWKAIGVCRNRFRHFSAGVGMWLSEINRQKKDELGLESVAPVKHDIKCVFSASLADHCGHEFDCVVIDEGTRIKGEDTIIGRAVRELDPRNRLVLTATPVKNRLRDIFWLIWWAAGGKDDAHARFPFTSDTDAQDQFSAEFNVCERNLTKEAEKRKGKAPKASKKKPRGKPGVSVCNIHRLWKLIAPNVLRRRKADFGEEIVKKLKHIVRCPMGKKQHEVYRYHLLGKYVDRNGGPAIVAQLTALRSVAGGPTSELLKQLKPECEGVRNGYYRSDLDYTPKLASALNIIEQRMRLGEQCVVFSAMHEPLDTLSKRLATALIPHDVLDGRKSQAWRGKLGKEFQRGLPRAKPVLLGGLKAMAEGNNWPKANNVIIIAYDWAWDLYEQAINRCHRLNSEKDINIWIIVADGTIDRKLESLTDEKGDSSELVLDGQLIGQDVEEVNLAELLRAAFVEFKAATVMDERQLEGEWPTLKEQLGEAWEACQEIYNPKPARATLVSRLATQMALL